MNEVILKPDKVVFLMIFIYIAYMDSITAGEAPLDHPIM